MKRKQETDARRVPRVQPSQCKLFDQAPGKEGMGKQNRRNKRTRLNKKYKSTECLRKS